MYKDGDYRGLSLEDVILAIHDELRENRAFLQMSLLDPDPDNRPAEALRIRKSWSWQASWKTCWTRL